MREARSKEWYITGKSVRGTIHRGNDLPNQDCIAWVQEETDIGEDTVLSLADGHGSEKYFLSHIGARIAVQVANDILYQFAQASAGLSLTDIKVGTERLPFQIVRQWRQLVEDDWNSPERLKEAEGWLDNPEIVRAAETSPLIAYGTTLLSVLVTERFILYLQIGDGDILAIDAHGEITEPVPPDGRNIANETTSLSNPTAMRDFRVEFRRRDSSVPALIMLATDGYANSFLTRTGFHKVGSDIWQMIRADGEAGWQAVEKQLEGWLQRTTELGSGDDISVGLLCRMSALQEEGPERLPAATQGVGSPQVPFQEDALSQQGIPGTALGEEKLDESTEKRSAGTGKS
jgi:hypothetical protein